MTTPTDFSLIFVIRSSIYLYKSMVFQYLLNTLCTLYFQSYFWRCKISGCTLTHSCAVATQTSNQYNILYLTLIISPTMYRYLCATVLEELCVRIIWPVCIKLIIIVTPVVSCWHFLGVWTCDYLHSFCRGSRPLMCKASFGGGAPQLISKAVLTHLWSNLFRLFCIPQ